MTLEAYSYHPTLMIGLRNRVCHMYTVLHLKPTSTGVLSLIPL